MPVHADPAPTDGVDIGNLSVAEIRAGYAMHSFSAEDLVQRYLQRIEQYESAYNAFTIISPSVLGEARLLDRRHLTGDKLGPLAGVPVIIKESINVAGLPSTAGWGGLSKESGGIEFIPQIDAVVVQRLRDAGALIMGKGNIPPFSASGETANNSWAGPTYNAVNRGLIPGGSSSGVATAVSAGFAVLGLAEETSGSIQNPAAAQALVGVKPTFGLVPTTGAMPLSASFLDVIGPHAKSVKDAAIMLEVIAGYSHSDPNTEAAIGNIPKTGYIEGLQISALKNVKVGLYGSGWSDHELSPETLQLYRNAIKVIRDLGASCVSDPFKDTGFADFSPANEWKQYFYGLESFVYDFNHYLKTTPSGTGIVSIASLIEVTGNNPFDDKKTNLAMLWKLANLKKIAKEKKGYLDLYKQPLDAKLLKTLDDIPLPLLTNNKPDLNDSIERRRRYLALFNKTLEEFGIDALVFPQQHEAIPELYENKPYPTVSSPHINTLGLPAVTIPAGYYANGEPFNLIFIGKKWSEDKLLAYAYAFEQATKGRIAPMLIEKID